MGCRAYPVGTSRRLAISRANDCLELADAVPDTTSPWLWVQAAEALLAAGALLYFLLSRMRARPDAPDPKTLWGWFWTFVIATAHLSLWNAGLGWVALALIGLVLVVWFLWFLWGKVKRARRERGANVVDRLLALRAAYPLRKPAENSECPPEGERPP